MIAGVVRNYYFPILAGKLSVEIGTVVIDRRSFHAVAGSVSGIANIPLGFVEEVSNRLESAPSFAGTVGINGSGLTARTFTAEQLAGMKAEFAGGGLLHVRVPVQLKQKGGANPTGSIDLFLKQLREGAKPFALFARGSITVPGEIRYFSGAHAFGAMVASDANIVAFLGDAENPAHTGWNANAERLAKNWRSPSATLRHKLLHSKAGLTNDRTNCSWFKVSSPMDGNGVRTPWIGWADKNVMAARNALNQEAGLGQCADDLPAADDRQSAAIHDYAAMVTRRISGRASEGMAMP